MKLSFLMPNLYFFLLSLQYSYTDQLKALVVSKFYHLFSTVNILVKKVTGQPGGNTRNYGGRIVQSRRSVGTLSVTLV
jgi:hypothetical protein